MPVSRGPREALPVVLSSSSLHGGKGILSRPLVKERREINPFRMKSALRTGGLAAGVFSRCAAAYRAAPEHGIDYVVRAGLEGLQQEFRVIRGGAAGGGERQHRRRLVVKAPATDTCCSCAPGRSPSTRAHVFMPFNPAADIARWRCWRRSLLSGMVTLRCREELVRAARLDARRARTRTMPHRRSRSSGPSLELLKSLAGVAPCMCLQVRRAGDHRPPRRTLR